MHRERRTNGERQDAAAAAIPRDPTVDNVWTIASPGGVQAQDGQREAAGRTSSRVPGRVV